MLELMGSSFGRAQNALDPGTPAGGFRWMAEHFGFSTAMVAANQLYLYPFRLLRQITVTSITQRVQTGQAGGAVKCAVWRNNPAAARPTGTPVLGQNTGFDATASTTNRTAAIASVVLEPAIYWGGTVGTASGTLPTMFHQGLASPLVVVGTSSDLGNVSGVSVAQTYTDDIMAANLTAATFTPVIGLSVPIVALGWS